jgi:C4-type Zn-finger protein
MSKQKKALVEVEVACPNCESKMRIIVHRYRINPVEPAVYNVDTTVELVRQGELFKGKSKEPKAKSKRTKVKVEKRK